jgi:putative endonuclease
MGRASDAVGAYGEQVAVDYLVRTGMLLIERNWRCRAGEIDAVFRDGPVLVFTEIKTRRGERFGAPAEAVGPAKRQRLRRLAALWLSQAETAAGGGSRHEVRFDVVSVRPRRSGAADVEHLRGAF